MTAAGCVFRHLSGSAVLRQLAEPRTQDPCEVTILFVPVSVPLERLATCWAEDSDEIILRRCPICEQDSIVGHGRRRKQAHDNKTGSPIDQGKVRFNESVGLFATICNGEANHGYEPLLRATTYSVRRAFSGSTLAARAAGIALASSAIAPTPRTAIR